MRSFFSILQAELTSVYLPALFRTVFDNPFDISTRAKYIVWSWYIQLALDAMIRCHPMSQRFVRLNELEARSFFVTLSQRIAVVSRSPYNVSLSTHAIVQSLLVFKTPLSLLSLSLLISSGTERQASVTSSNHQPIRGRCLRSHVGGILHIVPRYSGGRSS